MKTYRKIDNKVGVLGQNILILNKTILALYLIDSVNYSVLNENGVENHINRLESLLTTLSMQRPGFKFSILQIDKTLTKNDITKNIIDTVRLWDPSYNDIPSIFRNNIEKSYQEFSILAVNIDSKELSDVESLSIAELTKDYISKLSQDLFSMDEMKIDPKRLISIEQSLYDTISNYGERASRELTFYTYASSIFPSYELSYTKNSYVEKNLSPILGMINQTIESKFGYFVMSNLGVSMFGFKPQETYGCILNILKFPESINSSNFKLSLPNLRVNVESIPKEKSKLVIKRRRADLEFELETAMDAGAKDQSEVEDGLDLAERALLDISQGKILCNMNASILVLANDLDTLKTERQKIISALADIDVLASISFDQGAEFLRNYVWMSPQKYSHLTELRFPLSFQIDNSVILGDSDSEFASPQIGFC